MRIRQDLCIALVLAIVGVGCGRAAVASGSGDKALAVIEDAITESNLTAAEADRVRTLIAAARERERAGDEDGAFAALAEASAILKAV